MSMDIGNPYADLYYGYEYCDVETPEYTPGGGSGMTPEEVQQAIDDALSTINVTQVDDDTVSLNVNGSEAGTIDDVYLTGVERDDETNDVVFSLNNGKDPIRVKIDEFDNPSIDGSTF